MARKSQVIYNDDATVVERVTVTDEVGVIKHEAELKEAAISVADVIDTLAGYMVPTFAFIDDGGKSGKCVICGAKTSKGIRKLCADCMKNYGERFYSKAKEAVESGKKEVSL